MIDWANILWVGLVGGLAMSLMMTGARAMGLIDASMSRYQGCILTGRTEGAGTHAAGLMMHLVLSVLIAIVYAWALGQVWGHASWSLGLLGGAVHWAIAGLVLPMMDGMNPCVKRGALEPFGSYGSKRGAMMVAGFLMAHLLFGLLVGWLYSVPS